ncbi:MAG TPA: phage tail protein [Croceibacterium sp.]|nr:phage tail protein [Croceibacterium sp.]
MATLVLSAVGTALGGPIGGSIGALIGNQIDRAIIGSPKREGPRLKELAVTTSSYGSPIPRHYGTMRAAGTIIWSTDLVETSDESGGKGRPSTTTFSYSVSLAVALASRPIRALGRIWADGNLLRGRGGDLKTGGELRIYTGHGDQPADPLIASAQGAACPAFRGLAYCVLEALQLADFGNRIPALTFEIVADDGEVTLAELVAPLDRPVEVEPALPGLGGFSDEGDALAATLATVDQLYPLACDAGGERLTIRSSETQPANPPLLPEAAVDFGDDGFGGQAGATVRRQADARDIPEGLRYYDPSRDYQAGLQRADGRARPGRSRVLEFPGALSAETARTLANAAAERAGWARELLAWRVAELDPTIVPGEVVRVPGHAGHWRIESWEWRERGVELELRRLPVVAARQPAADPGQSLPAPDLLATPTQLHAYELPWDGAAAGDARQVFAAVSSESSGWTGAALYAEQAGELVPIGSSGSVRSVMGRIVAAVPGSAALLLDRAGSLEVEVVSDDFELLDAAPEALANGANRALVGGEVLQFAQATSLGGAMWRLTGLLRGRGGTEAAAIAGHAADTPFVLLDSRPVRIDPAKLGTPSAQALAAIGLADPAPVVSAIANAGATLRPLPPVHPRVASAADGGRLLQWTRRSRGAWAWPDGVELPLNEQAEAYLVGLGDAEAPTLRWELGRSRLELSAAAWAQLAADHSGQTLWVRQVGSAAMSDPLLLTVIS